MTKGLIVNVLRNDLLTSDCTNGGVSSKNKVFLLVGDVVCDENELFWLCDSFGWTRLLVN